MRKTFKFSVKTIESSLILENIIGFDGLIGIIQGSGVWMNNISKQNNVVKTVFRCVI